MAEISQENNVNNTNNKLSEVKLPNSKDVENEMRREFGFYDEIKKYGLVSCGYCREGIGYLEINGMFFSHKDKNGDWYYDTSRVELLKNFKHLERITLYQVPVSKISLELIANLPNLNKIEFRYCGLYGEIGMDNIKMLCDKGIKFDGSSCGPSGCSEEIREYIKQQGLKPDYMW